MKVTPKGTTLVFNEAEPGFFETLGFDSDVAKNILSRLDLFEEEREREIMSRFEDLTDEQKQELRDMVDGDDTELDEGFTRFCQMVGIEGTKTETLRLFLESPLFTSLGVRLQTSNDYLAIGFLWGTHIVKKSTKSLGAVSALTELIKILHKD